MDVTRHIQYEELKAAARKLISDEEVIEKLKTDDGVMEFVKMTIYMVNLHLLAPPTIPFNMTYFFAGNNSDGAKVSVDVELLFRIRSEN